MRYLEAKGAAVLEEKVRPENVWAWSAFQALRGSRSYGMTIGPIAFSEVASYCDFIGLSDMVQRQRLARFVMALDSEERRYGNAQSKG